MVECNHDKVEVAGSIPASPTRKKLVMDLEEYIPEEPQFRIACGAYCPKTGESGRIMKLFGKKCMMWIDGVPIMQKQVAVTYKLKDLVPEGHPDYKRNYNSIDLYRKRKKK